jgi:hypothetical protein
VDSKKTECIVVKIKSSKSNHSKKPEFVSVYATRSFSCPVKALKKYLKSTEWIKKDDPMFCLPSGKPFTPSQLNKYLNLYINIHMTKGKLSGRLFINLIYSPLKSLCKR